MAERSRIYYKPDHESFGRFMVSGQVRTPVIEVAREIAGLAKASSRRGAGPGPHMADQWRVNENAGTRTLITEGFANPRVRVDVYNPDIAAAAEEYGIRPGNQKRHTLREIAARFGSFTPADPED